MPMKLEKKLSATCYGLMLKVFFFFRVCTWLAITLSRDFIAFIGNDSIRITVTFTTFSIESLSIAIESQHAFVTQLTRIPCLTYAAHFAFIHITATRKIPISFGTWTCLASCVRMPIVTFLAYITVCSSSKITTLLTISRFNITNFTAAITITGNGSTYKVFQFLFHFFPILPSISTVRRILA